MQIFTVSRITAYIRGVFDADAELQDLWVEGEVSNCVRSTAGHMYFTLKDERAQIRCVLWRSQVAALEHVPANGDAIVVHGRVSVYEVQGSYQLYVDWVQPAGMGLLFLQLEALKEKLAEEGLFAPERKRPLPPFPRRIGVVTSPAGAAIRDILDVLARRYPLAEIIVAPTLVQGDDAPAQIVAAIDLLDTATDVDLIIVARGGGSLEDLWAFNSEQVARRIIASLVPVISGVGHETDFTIADFVADVRAPTPSAAAELAVPDQQVLREGLSAYQQALLLGVGQRLQRGRRDVDSLLGTLGRLSPRAQLDRQRQSVDAARQRAWSSLRHTMSARQERLTGLALRLSALNPDAVLQRGYAVVSHGSTGRVIRSVSQVGSGDPIDVRVSDGRFAGTVDGRSD
jgi:exodeoxyribonuclease VII large subunit